MSKYDSIDGKSVNRRQVSQRCRHGRLLAQRCKRGYALGFSLVSPRAENERFMEKHESQLLPKRYIFPKVARFLFTRFIAPRSQNEDDKRHEFILNILLLASIFLSLVCTLIVLANASGLTVQLTALAVFIIFTILLTASRRGYFRISAHILILVYTLPLTFMTWILGIDLPQILLSYSLLIVMSSVLISTRSSLLFTLLLSIFIASLSYGHQLGLWRPNQSWREEPFIFYDSLAFIVTFGAIATVSWLSNREIEKSLDRARRSEAELTQERDNLEIKVEERTAELKRVQTEKLSQLHRFVEFGRLASGLFHDLASPLTAVALNLESLKDQSSPAGRARQHVEQALRATKGLENFISAARKQLQTQEYRVNFDIVKETREVISVLSHKAKKCGVEIVCQLPVAEFTFGNPLKFHQVIANLLSNAIDAYEDVPKGQNRKPVEVVVTAKTNLIRISITDGGCGIAEAEQARIFEPFFTTKGVESGMGIGLSSTKNIVEKDFHGTISFTSVPGQGTSFTLSFPRASKTDAD